MRTPRGRLTLHPATSRDGDITMHRRNLALTISALLCISVLWLVAQENSRPTSHDAVMDAQQPQSVPAKRPEQKKTEHDGSNVFNMQNAQPSSMDFKSQPKQGKSPGFDPYKDP